LISRRRLKAFANPFRKIFRILKPLSTNFKDSPRSHQFGRAQRRIFDKCHITLTRFACKVNKGALAKKPHTTAIPPLTITAADIFYKIRPAHPS